MNEPELRVFMRHVRADDLCARGVRAWFAAHNLDYRDFLFNGVPVSVLEATGDPFAIRACEVAREEASQ